MASVDVAALTLAVTQLCLKTAWELRDFVHKVREAPQQARQMRMSLVALAKCLEKVQGVFDIPRQFSKEEIKYRNSIYQILESIQLDLETVREKLRLNKIVEGSGVGFWKNALTVFQIKLEDDDIKELQQRMESNQRILQTYFEMLLILSSWKTQDGLNQVAVKLQGVLISLLDDAKRIKPRRTSRSSKPQQDILIDWVPDDGSVSASSVAQSVLSSKHDDAVKEWKARSTALVAALTGYTDHHEGQSSRSSSPAMSDYDDNQSLGASFNTPRSSFSRVIPPEDQAEKDRLKKSLEISLKNSADELRNEKLQEAAESQQKAIGVIDQLKQIDTFPLDQEVEVRERLAEIHNRMGSQADMDRARIIIRELVNEEEARRMNDNMNPERRSRLYQTLSRIELRLGKFSDAYDSGRAAAYTKLHANPDVASLSTEDKESVKEAARVCFQAAMQIPDSSKATSTFYDITQKLGCPDLCLPVMVNVGQIQEWCKLQGFDVGNKDFWYDRCDDTAPGNVKGFSPIHQAIKTNAMYELTGMLASSCSLERRLAASYDDATPLLLACSERNTEAVALLLDKGARADATDRWGLNALHRCQTSISGGTDIARRLLTQGSIDVDDKDGHGKTALHYAAQTGNEDMLRFLLGSDGGANVNAQELGGDTPAMTALNSNIHNKLRVVKILVNHGAITSDKAQKTLMDTAKSLRNKEVQNKEVVRYLESLATPQTRTTSIGSSSSSGGCSCPHCGVHAQPRSLSLRGMGRRLSAFSFQAGSP